MNKSITQDNQNDNQISKSIRRFFTRFRVCQVKCVSFSKNISERDLRGWGRVHEPGMVFPCADKALICSWASGPFFLLLPAFLGFFMACRAVEASSLLSSIPLTSLVRLGMDCGSKEASLSTHFILHSHLSWNFSLLISPF